MSVDIGSILVVLEGETELFHKTLRWENTAFNVLTYALIPSVLEK